MFKHLNDSQFLEALDNVLIKKQYVKIIVLDFNEEPIREIQGQIQDNGTINVNGDSSLRRTTSFTMFADATTNDLTNIDNLISLNKKIKILVGYENNIKGYEHYGSIVWFKGGTYVIMQASLAVSTTGCTISIQGRDKMVMLNGQVGGTIPMPIVLQERQELTDSGSIIVSYPTLFQIIREVVSEFGNEDLNNIIISDLPLKTKQLIQYIGDENLHIAQNYSTIIENTKTNEQQNEKTKEDGLQWNTYVKSQNIGYQETSFTFPGELKMEAGSTVTQILDAICQILGNFEYFYDLDGKFVFQEKKNYLNKAYTPVTQLNSNSYIQNFGNSKYYYSFNNVKQVVSINSNPKYENIKNDFVVWGKKNDNTPILYHLAIEAKPPIFRANKYMWEVSYRNKYFLRYEYTDEYKTPTITLQEVNDFYVYKLAELYEKFFKDILLQDDIKVEELGGEEGIFDYFYQLALMEDPKEDSYFKTMLKNEDLSNNYETELEALFEEWELALKNYAEVHNNTYLIYTLIGKPCTDWREELYREALERATYGTSLKYYDSELLSFWRSIYNPMPQSIIKEEKKKTVDWYNEEEKSAWNPDVFKNPAAIKYWLDFLDDNDQMRKYGVSTIGRRTKVVTMDNVQNIFNFETPDLLFIENSFSDVTDKNKIIEELQGQKYIFYEKKQSSIFAISSTGRSAFDVVRDMLYQHFIYNTQINIVCLPKFYLEPNNLIYIADTNNGVYGDYIINQYTLPLNYKGTMNITATQALTRI